MRKCPYCGAELSDDTAICPFCSAELSPAPPVQPAAPEPPVVQQTAHSSKKPALHKIALTAIVCFAVAVPVLMIFNYAIRVFLDRKKPDITDDSVTAMQTATVQTQIVLDTETAAATSETKQPAATAADTQSTETASSAAITSEVQSSETASPAAVTSAEQHAETAPPAAETEPPKPEENDDWRYAYRDHVRNCDSQVNPTFSLYDVTGDGIPELFVSQGMFTAAGTEVYTFEKGAVRRMEFAFTDETIDAFGVNGMCAYDTDKNLLCATNVHMGYFYSTYMRYNGTNFEFAVSMMRSEFDPEWGKPDEYYLNDETVTKEVYEAEYQKYENDSYIALGTDFNIFDGQAIMDWKR